MLHWTYTIPDLGETFVVEAEDIATLMELRAAVLDMASRLTHNDAVLLGDSAAVRCDVCDTWVATHTMSVGKETYEVCDKPKCQDRIQARIDAIAYLEQNYHAGQQVIDTLLPLICQKYGIEHVSPELLVQEIRKAYEQIMLDEATMQTYEHTGENSHATD